MANPRRTRSPASLPFEVLTVTRVPLPAVALEHRATRRPGWDDDLEGRRIELVDRHIALGRPLLTLPDGSLPPLYRLDSLETTGHRLILHTSPTDYAEHLLTNVDHPQWRAERGDDVMADAIGVSGVLRTADGFVLVGRRSGRTHEAPGAFHVIPSGHPHPPQTVAEAIGAELHEELGLHPDRLDEAHVTGVIRALPSGKPEVTTMLTTSLTATEVRAAWEEADERWEFDELVGIPWAPGAVAEWMTDHARSCVAPGLAALALAGRIDFGPDWFDGDPG